MTSDASRASSESTSDEALPGSAGGPSRFEAPDDLPQPKPAARSNRRLGPVGPRFRTAVAFAMAAIAIGSATIAYHSAKWATAAADRDGLALQERAEQERMLQRINIVLAEDSRLFARYQAHFSAADAAIAEADSLRATNPDQAAILDLEYQGHWAVLGALWSFFQGPGPVEVEERKLKFELAAAQEVLIAQSPELRELDPDATQAEADHLHRTALALVLLIVVLVGALLVLTVSQVFRRGARYTAALGIGIAIGAAIFAAGVDPAMAPLLVAIALGAFLMFGIGRLIRRHPGRLREWITTGEEMADAAEASVQGASRSRSIHEGSVLDPDLADADLESDRTGKVVVVLIAAISVFAAWVGFVQIHTFHIADGEAAEAQHHSLMALAAEIDGLSEAEAGIFAHVRAVETEIAWSNTHQQRLYWLSVGDNDRANDLEGIERARRAEADATASADPISGSDAEVDYSVNPPAGDPYFPVRYKLRSEVMALMHSARQDQSNEASAQHTSRGRDLGFGVAVLAVVLYLLGLSLILRSNSLRAIFWVASGVLILICLARVLPALIPPTVPHLGVHDVDEVNALDTAAMEYATGLIGYQVASDPEDYLEALQHLRASMQLEPGSARSHIAIAAALAASTAVQTSGYASIDDPKSRVAAIDGPKTARSLHAEARGVSGDMGFYLFREAIDGQAIDAATLADSIAATREAIAAASSEDYEYRALTNANLGVALLAAGRPEDADRAYSEAARNVTSPGGGTDGNAFWWRDQVVAGALTDLDNLATRHGALEEPVARAKEALITRVYAPRGGQPVALSDMAIDYFPAMLQWSATAPSGSTLEERSVVVEWYRLDPKSGDWFVLPDISGVGMSAGRVIFSPDASATNGYFGQGLMTASPVLRCQVDADQYRVEVYVDGALAGRKTMVVGNQDALPQEAAQPRAGRRAGSRRRVLPTRVLAPRPTVGERPRHRLPRRANAQPDPRDPRVPGATALPSGRRS